jgi:hypothetical protein
MKTAIEAFVLRRRTGELVGVLAGQALWLESLFVAVALLSASFDCLSTPGSHNMIHGLVGLGVVLQLFRRLDPLTGPSRSLESSAWAALGWKAARDSLIVAWFLLHVGDREHAMVALASLHFSTEGVVYARRALQQRRHELKAARAVLLLNRRQELLRVLDQRRDQLLSEHPFSEADSGATSVN